MTRKAALAALAASFLLSTPAIASEKDREISAAMEACFNRTASALDDKTTPIDDLADVVIGQCWDEVNEHRRRWTDDWGVGWAGQSEGEGSSLLFPIWNAIGRRDMRCRMT